MKKITLFLSLFSLLFFLFLSVQKTYAATLLNPNPVISRDVPASASDDCFGGAAYKAANADDADYATQWRSCLATPSAGSPVTLTYDLSGVSSSSRGNVVVAWYNDPATGAYNHNLISVNAYNIPKDYTIQGNTAAGGGSAPASGWVTLQTITGNVYHSRQVQVDLTGYNWLRISVTASEGSALNEDVQLNLDVHDVSQGISDDWIFFGDSITQQAFLHTGTYGGTFSQEINTWNSSYFPLYESGGMGGFTSGDAVTNFSTWLALFPGKFVVLSYGTNDANINVSATTFYNNMTTLVQDVLAANKIPIIPTIPWGCTANLTANVPGMNAKISQLYTDFPQIIEGPDLYAYFNAHQSEISGDCIHPTDPGGYTDYLTQWVNAMETAVYTAPAITANPTTGTYTSAQSVTLTSSKTGTVYYTTDGSTPTTASSVYSTPISITSTTTVKSLAVDQAGNQSNIDTEIYTFSSGSSSSSTSSSSTSSSSSPLSPNVHAGWSNIVMAGPSFIGTPSFITGSGEASGAMTFISPTATANDLFITITKTDPTVLAAYNTPFPWMQGLNTAGNIFNFQAVAAFNGYPSNQFLQPVTIVIPYDATRLAGLSPNQLSLALYNPTTRRWNTIAHPVINYQQQTLAATTKQFSYAAVVYPSSASTTLYSTLTNNIQQTQTPTSLPSAQAQPSEAPKAIQPITISPKPQPKQTSNKSCFLFICW